MRLLTTGIVLLQVKKSVDAFMASITSLNCDHRSINAEVSSATIVNAVKPSLGSIVTIDCALEPEGSFVPEQLIDTNGIFTFVLGGGNYLPGLHDLLGDMEVGEKVEGISLDAGWGSVSPSLVATVKKAEMSDQFDLDQLKVGVELYLVNGMKAVVTEISNETFTIDANPPLAGTSYSATVELINVEDGPTEFNYLPEGSNTPFQIATFALGCFWSGELEFMRQEGVVGTKVGYTQGETNEPTYEEVCSGTTGHTEAIMVIYDERVVTYEHLVTLAMNRLGENKYLLNQVGNDRGTQYRHGIYYHNDMQQEIALKLVKSFGDDVKTEVLPAKKFWDAEEYHMQYLLKGGQSARKGATETIRCYG